MGELPGGGGVSCQYILVRRVRMVPPEPLLHCEEPGFLKISHATPHRAFGHLQLPRHGGDGRPAHTLPVGPAPQVEVNGDGPVGQVALVEFLKVGHLPAPSPEASCAWRGRWRGLWPLAAPLGRSVEGAPVGQTAPRRSPGSQAAPPPFEGAAGTSPGWLSPGPSSRRRPQAGCPCRRPCTAPQR